LNEYSLIYDNGESILHFTDDISTLACPESNLQHKSDAESFPDCTSSPANSCIVRTKSLISSNISDMETDPYATDDREENDPTYKPDDLEYELPTNMSSKEKTSKSANPETDLQHINRHIPRNEKPASNTNMNDSGQSQP
ncbi:hypothetical protein CBL_21408, partial [Carabus blaptoides fortunei]